jgi:hypothetical protein
MGKLALVAVAMLVLTAFNLGTRRLEWMSGHWLQERGQGWSEESWIQRGHVLVGVGASGSGEVTRSYEFMRIDNDQEGNLTFWGAPQGQPPVPFKMTSMTPNDVVFENPEHDYPTRISYRREGKTLIATTSGPGGSNPLTWHYRRVRD